MKKTLLAITSALILTGAMSSTAFAQSGYYERDDGYYSDAYDDRGYAYSREDMDRDGVYDEYDSYDNRSNQSWDRDRDGRNDRYQADSYGRDGYYDSRDGRYDNRYNDNRYDRGDNRYDYRRAIAQRRYHAGRYSAPRGYRYVRYDIGSRLPRGYYGSNYYVDYRPYGLSAPPRGYRWNRVGSDAYLVSVTNGLVRQVMYSLFY